MQPADLAGEEEEDVGDVRMDGVLMLDQEPTPEYDVDDEQRPRLSRVSSRWCHAFHVCPMVHCIGCWLSSKHADILEATFQQHGAGCVCAMCNVKGCKLCEHRSPFFQIPAINYKVVLQY